MTTTRAWSLITTGGSQQYAGNLGYADDPRHTYRYDSNVANCRNVLPGDLALVRDRRHLIGMALIERVTEQPGKKTMLRCPVCASVGLKARSSKLPRFRCNEGHEFDQPREDVVDVTTFEAHYPTTFVDAPDAVPVADIKAAAPRRSDQLSIEEVDIRRLETALLHSYPATAALISDFYQRQGLRQDEADDERDLTAASDLASKQNDTYQSSLGDTRQAVLRSIKQRRGQQKFRNALLKRYGPRCMVTGCEIVDIVEAAHIWPYRGAEDNHPENGLLLRADVHTLFDLNLIAVDPGTLTIATAPELAQDGSYSALQGRELGLRAAFRPSLEPLIRRWRVFTAKCGKT